MKIIKDTHGFTLIELIVVIVIVAILAAIAIPRFINQTTKARIAALNGIGSAINSAVMLAVAEYQAEAVLTSTSISMSGQTVAVVAGKGYPTGAAVGIGSAVRVIQGFIPTYGAVTQYNFSVTVPNCNVQYTAATGDVVVTTTGC